MTVKWAKNSQATGYQIRYKTGTTVRTVTVKGAATLTKVIKGLAKGKTYTVTIRAYRTVSGVNTYSAWSSAKNVKITK
jgi:alpha-D-ribose 1-methylphosphonate 5-phosphate C-P lyase